MVLIIAQLLMALLLVRRLISHRYESFSVRSAFPLTTFLVCFSALLLAAPSWSKPSWLMVIPSFIAFVLTWRLQGEDCEISLPRFKEVGWGLGISVIAAIFFALRPVIFEYPSDNVAYLSSLLGSLVGGSQRFLSESCSLNELFTYSYDCKLWLLLARQGPGLSIQSIFPFGLSVPRLIVGAEILVFCLALQVLFRIGGVRGWHSSLAVILVLTGLGNKGISFVINHALQGSILAAALLTEVFILLLWIISVLQEAASQGSPWPRRGLKIFAIASSLFLLQVFLLLRLHGLFALLAIVAILPLVLFVGADGISRFGLLGLRRADAWFLLILGFALTAVFIGPMDAWRVQIADSWYVQRWTWAEALGVPYEALPASFMTRAPHSRPELIAAAGILLSFGTLVGLYSRAEWLASFVSGPDRRRYAIVGSFYSISIGCIILLPPFSNIFLNLNVDLFSHYRLMWGAVLFSPLPLWLGFSSRLGGILTGALATVALLPVPFWSLDAPQWFHSKSRHIFVAPQRSSDQEYLLRELMPLLSSRARGSGQLPTVLADPQVNDALHSFSYGRLKLLAPAYRLTRPDQRSRVSGLQDYDSLRVLAALLELPLHARPNWIIQRRPSSCSYSVYVDSRDYDPCVSQVIQNSFVNRLGAKDLAGLGYSPVMRGREVVLWRLSQSLGHNGLSGIAR